MPRVNVILKNGTAITVEGAVTATWLAERLAQAAMGSSLLLVVQGKEADIRGKFRAEDVAGFTIELE